jgi:cysteine-rich repeat protein
VASEACDADCTFAVCGDWTLNQAADEFCDRGGVDVFECDFDCSEARCGDGYANESHEQCDDGNQDNADGCSGCTLI